MQFRSVFIAVFIGVSLIRKILTAADRGPCGSTVPAAYELLVLGRMALRAVLRRGPHGDHEATMVE